MNRTRFWAVCVLDLKHNLRRPLFWIWALIVVLTVWGMSHGGVRISSGDSTVGGQKAYVTSEFANAMLQSLLVLILYSFFIAVGAGMSIIRDEEQKVGEVLHATPLRPREYVWGKFAACYISFLAILSIHVAGAMFFNHALSDADSGEFVGPFSALNYLKPALLFALPTLTFVAGLCFFIGERTRKPILVFVIPVALFVGCGFFLWNWSPSWLDPRINSLLMWIDPSGFRWLNETWLTEDKGVAFYNTAPIGLDIGFVLSRLAFLAMGLLGVVLAGKHFTKAVRRPATPRSLTERLFGRRKTSAAAPPAVPTPLSALKMRSRRPGFLRGLLTVARAEFRELRSQPGLYLFVPIIIIEVVSDSMLAVGALDTPLLNTPGTLAVRSFGVLVTLTCLLLMFYMVESLRREESTGLAPIYYATPVRTTSLIFGKAFANSFVCVAILGAAFVSMVVVLLVQEKVAFDPRPYLLVWGLILLPTLFLWATFVAAVYALTKSRYTAYGVALGVLIFTGYQAIVGEVSWVSNWPLWGVLQWTDMGEFELNRSPLIYTRVMALGAGLFFTALTVRVFPRRAFDATRVVTRLRPKALLRSGLILLPFAILPFAVAITLQHGIDTGFQGDQIEKRAKDYWRKNLATWRLVDQPDLAHVEVALRLDPAERSMEVDGTYVLENLHDETLHTFALSSGLHWRDLTWTLDGETYEPEDRAGLFVFTPTAPLTTGMTAEVGFTFVGTFPSGMTSNGGGAGEFVLPSGVVLTSFSPSFVPTIGFIEGRGIDEDNSYEAREYADDFHVGITRSAFGTSQPFTLRTSITAPTGFTTNGVGTRIDEQVDGNWTTTVWEADHPVRFFNVVGGKWDVRRGDGTAIYYHPAHSYNLDEMIEALDAARKFYSEWFYPFPWSELKVSEFPALAGYAQGFPTNISFSEAIGFLTESDERSNAAFMVMAHESAHQWWGNIVNPGDGPGGNILSEGKAHFSTMLLFEQVLGDQARMEFCKNIEATYNDTRSLDSERELYKTDGSRAGDGTVQYDKGGWVFWMLYQLMGREPALAGIQSFIAHYAEDRDHPVLQDYVAHMRDFAPEPEAFDAFVKQWFAEVVLPEYTFTDGVVEPDGDGWRVRAHIKNIGSGTMPIQIAAVSGQRFPDEESDDDDASDTSGDDADASTEPAVDYRESRVTVVLGADTEQEISIRCDFEPERLVVDPDVLVLQRGRKRAALDL